MNFNKNIKDHGIILFILFILQPFITFLFAIYNLKYKYSFIVIFIFFSLFGLTFIAEFESADSFRYVEEFKLYNNYSLEKYKLDIIEYFSFDTNRKDIYTITSYYIVSLFSQNYHILMALWAMVFSYFFLKSLKFLVFNDEFKKSIFVSLLVFFFIFSNNIFNINGVRFYTAAWIAVYSIFEITVNNKKYFLILLFITTLVHISFFSIFILGIIFILTSNFPRVWFIIFIVSFFISEISILLIKNNQFEFSAKAVNNMMSSYTSEEIMNYKKEELNTIPLYSKVLYKLPIYLILLFQLVIIINYNKVKSNKKLVKVLIFSLIIVSFSNFTMAIPSLGARFIQLSIPLISYISLFIYKKSLNLRILIVLIPFTYSYIVFQWLRLMSEVTDPYLFVSFFPHLLLKNL